MSRGGYQCPFLKWAGSKYRLLTRIIQILPRGNRLIEPFAGSADLFLNTEYERYLVNDINTDLISLYPVLQKEGKDFVNRARSFFTPQNNTPDVYYRLRARFNNGYNGLCRYSASGVFNVPFRPYFPGKEMVAFHIKA
jgi:DNA adenine methylase